MSFVSLPRYRDKSLFDSWRLIPEATCVDHNTTQHDCEKKTDFLLDVVFSKLEI